MNFEIDYYKEKVNIFAHTSVPWQQEVLFSFVNHITLPINPKILDVGSGIGNNVKTLMSLASSITATDISDKVLAVLKERYKEASVKIDTVASHMQELPFNDNSFDLVVCTEVLEHIENLPKAIGECMRVLKPNGYIILSSPNYFNPAGFIKIIFELMHPDKSWDAWGNHEDGHEDFMTSFKLRRVTKKSGVQILETRGGDVMRSWLPFFRRYYKYIDQHPMLSFGRLPIIKYFLMNFFILGKKV